MPLSFLGENASDFVISLIVLTFTNGLVSLNHAYPYRVTVLEIGVMWSFAEPVPIQSTGCLNQGSGFQVMKVDKDL